MQETKLIKKAYLKHEVQRLIDIARYEELSNYYMRYDKTGMKARARLEVLKKRVK